MSLQQLNDECLEHIFKHLNLEQQFKMKSLQCTRFDDVIDSLWRRKTKALCMPRHLRFRTGYESTNLDCLRHKETYEQFMSVVAGSLQSLDLINAEQLNSLAKLTFPKVVNLTVTLRRDFRGNINLAKIFPALERLNFNTGVSYDIDFDPNDHSGPGWKLRKCLFALPLSVKLSELLLDEHFMLLIVKHLATCLPSLRLITATHNMRRQQVLLPLIAALWPEAQQVHTLGYNFYRSSSREHLDAIGKFRNVQELHLMGASDTIERFGVELERLITELPHLRAIHFSFDSACNCECFERRYVYKFIIFMASIVRHQQQNLRWNRSLELHCYAPDLEYYFQFKNIKTPQTLRLSLYDHRVEPFLFTRKVSFVCDARETKAK